MSNLEYIDALLFPLFSLFTAGIKQSSQTKTCYRASEAGKNGNGDRCRWSRCRSKHSSELSMGSLRNQHTHTHQTLTRSQTACVDPPAVCPFCFCSETHILSDCRNPSVAAHTLQQVCGRAELLHRLPPLTGHVTAPQGNQCRWQAEWQMSVTTLEGGGDKGQLLSHSDKMRKRNCAIILCYSCY